MKNLLRDIGGAVGLGLLWAVAGALAALPIEAFIDPDGAIADVWVAVLAYPGFFGGVIFFTLLRIFEGRRNFAEISLRRATAWGALSGVLLPVLFALAIRAGLGTVNGAIPWLRVAGFAGTMILAFAVAACVTVALCRSVKVGRERRAETGRT